MATDWKQIVHSPFAVGAVGAVIAAVKFTPGASGLERAFNTLAGMAAAGFLTPALVEYIGKPAEAFSSATAFILGLISMSLAAAVSQGIRETSFAEIVKSWLMRR